MPPARRSTPRPAPRARARTPARGGARPQAAAGAPGEYWTLSIRPLHVLLFLAPLVALYELGSALYLTNPDTGTQQVIQAQRLLGDFFDLLGVAGLFVPGIALLTVLVVWHVLLGDPWRARPGVLGGMLVESIAWTMPLLVLAALHSRATTALAETGPPVMNLHDLSWQARLTISIGAGLYEEMLFRFVLIAALHLVLVDLAQVKTSVANPVCVLVAAAAFALYHDHTLADGSTDWARLLFYMLGGLYLGTVYILRGLGIVVGTHAVYDVLVLVVFRG